MHDSELIGSREACRLLDIDKSTLSRWVESGRLPLVQKMPGANGAFVFSRATVERIAGERAASAAS